MSSPLVTLVAQHILAGAAEGTFAVSQLLPSERELADTLTVSRSTVTTAYTELERRGAIRRIRGKGAYLCALPAVDEKFLWAGKISRFANAVDEPVLELLARTCAGDLPYPLSAGTPSLEVFSKEDYSASVNTVLQTAVPQALAVAPTEGQWALRNALKDWLGVPVQNVMVTAGAQEGIDLMARCLIEPGDYVLTDSPSYPGALQSFLSAGARLLPWNTDWSLDNCEKLLLRYRPKLIFTTPTFQNPTGRVMSLKTRKGLLDLAQRYRVPILEDDVYRRTCFKDDAAPRSLYQLDTYSLVVNVSTFSKMFAPGIRIGWVLAPHYMIKQLCLIKMRSNLFTAGLNQLVLADLIRNGAMDEHLRRLRRHHHDLCVAAVEALQPAVDNGLLRFRIPRGSLYLWCKVLCPIDMEAFTAALDEQGVSVAPGLAFEPDRTKTSSPYFRICFTAVGSPILLQALRRLNAALEQFSARGPLSLQPTSTP